jgi:sodium-dependent dicarboxylate transporter 2/3/5
MDRRWLAAAACLVAVALVEILLSGATVEQRRAVEIFALAIIGWTLTELDDTFVALAAAVAMAIFVIGKPDNLFAALGDNVVWLLVAAFIFAAALKASGLAQAFVTMVARRARTVRSLFYALTLSITVTSFFIPATTGRAALLLPVFKAFCQAVPSEAQRKSLALLFPTVILLSAFASLVGAAAHVAAAELLFFISGQTISFATWTLYGLPFALISVLLATEIILRLFMPPADRAAGFTPPPEEGANIGPLWRQPVAWILGAVLVGWLTAPLHGQDETLIAIIGALAITAPYIRPIRFKAALKEVDWNLLLFLAATIFLAEGLIASELVSATLGTNLSEIGRGQFPPIAVIAIIASVGLLMHLVVHSRTARVAILVPPVLVLADELGMNEMLCMLVAVAATGVCQTLMVSAKPVIVYGQMDGETFTQRDLFKLSAVLLPLHFALILLFAGIVWPAMGLPLTRE